MKKPFPDFSTDAEAEAFVASADLSEYDFSDLKPVRFQRNTVDPSITVTLPVYLLDAVRTQAERAGLPAQSFIRLAIERALAIAS